MAPTSPTLHHLPSTAPLRRHIRALVAAQTLESPGVHAHTHEPVGERVLPEMLEVRSIHCTGCLLVHTDGSKPYRASVAGHDMKPGRVSRPLCKTLHIVSNCTRHGGGNMLAAGITATIWLQRQLPHEVHCHPWRTECCTVVHAVS